MTIDKEDKTLLSGSDFKRLLNRSKTKIFLCMAFMGLCGALYALNKPIEYKAEATFRERSSQSGGSLKGGLADLFLLGNQTSDFEIFSYIQSHLLMNDAIDKMNLQATLLQDCDQENFSKRIYRNVLIEWNYFKKSLFPVLKERVCPLKIASISYPGETPTFLKLDFDGDKAYRVLDLKKNEIGKGEIGRAFVHDDYSFIIALNDEGSISPQVYTLILSPKPLVAANLIDKLKCESSKDDKKVLKLIFVDRNRKFASEFLNVLMGCYQDLLKAKHDRIAKIQMDYLHEKEHKSEDKLKTLLTDHADFIASDLYLSGFSDSEAEMNFLSKSQHQYKEKLIANELEMRRLKVIQPNSCVYYDQLSKTGGDTSIVNRILTEIRELKQQRDGLELALRKQGGLENIDLQQAFVFHMDELNQVQEYNDELDILLEDYKRGLRPKTNTKLWDDPRFLIKDWFLKLDEIHEINPEMYDKTKDNFTYYLDNLRRLFGVHEKILKERLTHQQNTSPEFEGINLTAANELYIQYCKELMQEESAVRQNLFIITQIESPDFEITSLSSVLRDPVSLNIIKDSSSLILSLKDQNNQSQKELERLQRELDLQRVFLTLHLKQMNQIVQVNQKLINEKILSLQNISLELIHQRISLLEENLRDYVQSRFENLEQEKEVINQHLEEINEEMAFLPKRRVHEQLIEQQLEVNMMMVQEIAKMVEGKNISHNLEVIQSAPIDKVIPPIHPKKPGLFFYTLFGSFFGGLLGSVFVVGRALAKGLPVSVTMLRSNGQNVAGSFSEDYDPKSSDPIKDVDLQTLRRLYSFFENWSEIGEEKKKNVGKLLLLIEGHGPDYSYDLAELISFKGKKSVILDLSFDQVSVKESQPGLLSYLENACELPKIVSSSRGDRIYSGGISRFSTELLRSRRFQDLLTQLTQQYDWVIAVTNSYPHSASAESLAQGFPLVAVTVHNEILSDLQVYLDRDKDALKETAFIFAPGKN